MRDVTFFVLVIVFAVRVVLFGMSRVLIRAPYPRVAALAIGCGLLGLLLVALTVKQKEPRIHKTLFLLTGASAAGIPICAILHNLV
jgi:hypothetical protein